VFKKSKQIIKSSITGIFCGVLGFISCAIYFLNKANKLIDKLYI
jgi:hypothetical protein